MDSSLVSFCRRMRSVAKLFRFVELFLLLAFLSWLSTRLPFAVRISGEYCRRFSALILSPPSIFLLGNAIIGTLLAKSGLFSSKAVSSVDNAVAEFYDELRFGNHDETTPASEEEIVFQDKEIICEENTKMAIPKADNNNKDDENVDEEVVFPEVKEKHYQRSKSESLKTDEDEDKKRIMKQKVRRSETDICRSNFSGGKEDFPEEDDDVSSEEFQRTIEAFIARQVRFHREERLAVVLHGQA